MNRKLEKFAYPAGDRVNVTPIVTTPQQVISIGFELDGAGGSKECEAWRGQYEIDTLVATGARITHVSATPC